MMSGVPKTQIDREIAAALGLHTVPVGTGNYYYVADRGRQRTIYGPYATSKDAAFAGYFHKPVADRDKTPANIFFSRGVQEYDEDEIASLLNDPGEYDFKSVKLVHRAPPMHASWKKLGDDEFRQYIRNKDHELAEQLSSRRW